MTRRNDLIKGSAAALGMALLILDTKTALAGAQKGMELCLKTVIPSLFPFFLLSILLTGSLMGTKLRILRPVCRLCRIPEAAESLLVAGFLGGYPVGAQCVSQAYEAGQLSQSDARRLLGFCNNCGPAFLFGMAAGLFESRWISWALWGIHILSALITAVLIPGKSAGYANVRKVSSISFVQSLSKALRVMASVCGWVVIFRILITFLNRWALWLLPEEMQVTVLGLLELSNGCVELYSIENLGLRFILCAAFLSFGGLCVALQTVSVISPQLDRSAYFPGKVLQCCVSAVLASFIQLAFPAGDRVEISLWIPAIAGLTAVLFLRKNQISSSIRKPVGV